MTAASKRGFMVRLRRWVRYARGYRTEGRIASSFWNGARRAYPGFAKPHPGCAGRQTRAMYDEGMTDELAAKRDRLLAILGDMPGAAVAFSGGIDSTVVARA